MTSIRHGATLALIVALSSAGCASGPPELPEPRPLVLHSGARLSVEDDERLQEIYQALTEEMENIEQDPSFLIDTQPDARALYPWETLEIIRANRMDTARVHFQRTAPDIVTAYQVYAHLHLMREVGRIDEWMPEAAEAEGWALERAIVGRMTDVWLLGRAVYDLTPYVLLDRLIYAQEAGQLDALLLTLRADEFAEAREEWLAANPGADEAFRAWYRETFAEDPPSPTGS
jgi:hypothetical protein